MTLVIDGHSFHFEMENLCRVFFPNEQIKVVYESINDDLTVVTGVKDVKGKTLCIAEVSGDRGSFSCSLEVENIDKHSFERQCEITLAKALFDVLRRYTGKTPKWGILTGIRPVKLFRILTQDLGSKEKALQCFTDGFFVSPKKAKLCSEIAAVQESIIKLSRPESFSLYVSIPFCPSRCSYCSFVSHSIEKALYLVEQYVELMCRELEYTAGIAKALGLRLETIYFGGGTPTVLDAGQLLKLHSVIEKNFDMSTVREYTIEAGRPDTIDESRLHAMKSCGVSRISINPQTLDDKVLKAIGRRHTVQQALSAFWLARDKGFDNINMDIIAGLPSDSLEGFQKTVKGIVELCPENITIHTLALKRASSMAKNVQKIDEDEETVGLMLEFVHGVLKEAGFYPYYLYRQSKTLGNLENCGFCRAGTECLYNVYMMDEIHTILAVGAGAVSKLKEPKGPYIERIFNFKFPYEYINHFEQILKRKERIGAFYERK